MSQSIPKWSVSVPENPALLARVVLGPSRRNLFSGCLVGLPILLLLWACLSEVDVIIQAPGRVRPSQSVQSIATRFTSQVRAIHVQEGQRVDAGDVLLELDAHEWVREGEKALEQRRNAEAMQAMTRHLLEWLPEDKTDVSVYTRSPVVWYAQAGADGSRVSERTGPAPESASESESESESALALQWTFFRSGDITDSRERHRSEPGDIAQSVARMQSLHAMRRALATELQSIGLSVAQIQGWHAHLDAITADCLSKARRLSHDAHRAQQGVVWAHTRWVADGALMQSGFVSRQALAEKLRLLEEAQAHAIDIRHQWQNWLTQTRRELRERHTEAGKTASAAQIDHARFLATAQQHVLVAPVSGHVHQLALHTVGGVAAAAQTLMQIVPDAAYLEVEALVQNRDVGFIQVGQAASVRLDAFDYTRHGAVDATVLRVGRDAVGDDQRGWLYPVRLSMQPTERFQSPMNKNLSAGLSSTVDIRVGKRRLIAYVLSPLLRYRNEAMREP